MNVDGHTLINTLKYESCQNEFQQNFENVFFRKDPEVYLVKKLRLPWAKILLARQLQEQEYFQRIMAR